MGRIWAMFGAAGAVAASVVVATAGPASAQTPMGTVTVVHGLRGVVADVYVDGQLALPTFQPDRVTDPIQVPAGSHHVEIRQAGDPATAPPAVTADVDVIAGGRQSIVAHLSSTGAPTVTVYQDDMSPVPAGQTRAVIRHTAAAGPVDVSLDTTVVAAGLAEPGSTSATVAPATYQVSVANAGSLDPVAAPQSATLSEGAATVMYLIGSAPAGTLSWVAEQLPGLATPPNNIQTGDSGLAATGRSGTTVPVVPIAAGAGAALGAVVAVILSRRSRVA